MGKKDAVVGKPAVNQVARPAVAPPPAQASAVAEQPPSAEDIRLRAYQKWEAAGCPAGDGAAFWLEAERELLRAR